MSATQYKTNERERDEIPHLLSALETAEEVVHSNPGSWYMLHETGGNKVR